MKSDLYTKIILTVIAFALTGLLLKDIGFIPTAKAARPSEIMDVNIESVNPLAFNRCEVPVDVKEPIGPHSKRFPIEVEVVNTSAFDR